MNLFKRIGRAISDAFATIRILIYESRTGGIDGTDLYHGEEEHK